MPIFNSFHFGIFFLFIELYQFVQFLVQLQYIAMCLYGSCSQCFVSLLDRWTSSRHLSQCLFGILSQDTHKLLFLSYLLIGFNA